MRSSIDINCDLGEGYPNDAELMKFISSANVACGFHAGDEYTMRHTVRLAIDNNVAIGAHPSFPDRENFGRTNMYLTYEEVSKLVAEQISDIKIICDDLNAHLHHVKPHGALYNMAVKDPELAKAIANAVAEFDRNLFFFGSPNSPMIYESERLGLRTASEVFADRTYQRDGSLTPRSESNALIENIDDCIEHVLRMIREQKVIATDGSEVPIKADTICIHGDGEHAVEFASAIHNALTKEGFAVRPN
jgi:UPF0271 protein